MMPTMFEVGCDLLRVASFALAAHGYQEMGENLLRTGMELIEGAAEDIEREGLPTLFPPVEVEDHLAVSRLN
jgi:hypothetical protein